MQRQGLLPRNCGTSHRTCLKYRVVWINKNVDRRYCFHSHCRISSIPLKQCISIYQQLKLSLPQTVFCNRYCGHTWQGKRITVDFFFNLVIITCKRIASSQTSSFFGQTSVPFMMVLRAACMRPVTSSRRAAAIQPRIGNYPTKLCCH